MLQPIIIQPWLDKSPKYSLQVDPPSISFTTDQVGSAYEQIVSIKNNGYVDVPISRIPAVKDFVLSPQKDSTVIRAGDAFYLGISYHPSVEAQTQETSFELVFGCGDPLKLVVPISVVNALSP